MPWNTLEEVPKRLRHLGLQRANRWARIFDAVKGRGQPAEQAAAIATSSEALSKAGEQTRLARVEHRPHQLHAPTPSATGKCGSKALLPSKTGTGRRFQCVSRQRQLVHGEQARELLHRVHRGGGQHAMSRAAVERKHVQDLQGEGLIHIHRNPVHHAHEFTVHLTAAGHRHVEAERRARVERNDKAQARLFKAVGDWGLLADPDELEKAKTWSRPGAEQVGLFGARAPSPAAPSAAATASSSGGEQVVHVAAHLRTTQHGVQVVQAHEEHRATAKPQAKPQETPQETPRQIVERMIPRNQALHHVPRYGDPSLGWGWTTPDAVGNAVHREANAPEGARPHIYEFVRDMLREAHGRGVLEYDASKDRYRRVETDTLRAWRDAQKTLSLVTEGKLTPAQRVALRPHVAQAEAAFAAAQDDLGEGARSSGRAFLDAAQSFVAEPEQTEVATPEAPLTTPVGPDGFAPWRDDWDRELNERLHLRVVGRVTPTAWLVESPRGRQTFYVAHADGRMDGPAKSPDALVRKARNAATGYARERLEKTEVTAALREAKFKIKDHGIIVQALGDGRRYAVRFYDVPWAERHDEALAEKRDRLILQAADILERAGLRVTMGLAADGFHVDRPTPENKADLAGLGSAPPDLPRRILQRDTSERERVGFATGWASVRDGRERDVRGGDDFANGYEAGRRTALRALKGDPEVMQALKASSPILAARIEKMHGAADLEKGHGRAAREPVEERLLRKASSALHPGLLQALVILAKASQLGLFGGSAPTGPLHLHQAHVARRQSSAQRYNTGAQSALFREPGKDPHHPQELRQPKRRATCEKQLLPSKKNPKLKRWQCPPEPVEGQKPEHAATAEPAAAAPAAPAAPAASAPASSPAPASSSTPAAPAGSVSATFYGGDIARGDFIRHQGRLHVVEGVGRSYRYTDGLTFGAPQDEGMARDLKLRPATASEQAEHERRKAANDAAKRAKEAAKRLGQDKVSAELARVRDWARLPDAIRRDVATTEVLAASDEGLESTKILAGTLRGHPVVLISSTIGDDTRYQIRAPLDSPLVGTITATVEDQVVKDVLANGYDRDEVLGSKYSDDPEHGYFNIKRVMEQPNPSPRVAEARAQGMARVASRHAAVHQLQAAAESGILQPHVAQQLRDHFETYGERAELSPVVHRANRRPDNGLTWPEAEAAVYAARAGAAATAPHDLRVHEVLDYYDRKMNSSGGYLAPPVALADRLRHEGVYRGNGADNHDYLERLKAIAVERGGDPAAIKRIEEHQAAILAGAAPLKATAARQLAEAPSVRVVDQRRLAAFAETPDMDKLPKKVQAQIREVVGGARVSVRDMAPTPPQPRPGLGYAALAAPAAIPAPAPAPVVPPAAPAPAPAAPAPAPASVASRPAGGALPVPPLTIPHASQPKLNGSEKQVAWAQDIRRNTLARLEDRLKSAHRAYHSNPHDDGRQAEVQRLGMLHRFAGNTPSAKALIDIFGVRSPEPLPLAVAQKYGEHPEVHKLIERADGFPTAPFPQGFDYRGEVAENIAAPSFSPDEVREFLPAGSNASAAAQMATALRLGTMRRLGIEAALARDEGRHAESAAALQDARELMARPASWWAEQTTRVATARDEAIAAGQTTRAASPRSPTIEEVQTLRAAHRAMAKSMGRALGVMARLMAFTAAGGSALRKGLPDNLVLAKAAGADDSVVLRFQIGAFTCTVRRGASGVATMTIEGPIPNPYSMLLNDASEFTARRVAAAALPLLRTGRVPMEGVFRRQGALSAAA